MQIKLLTVGNSGEWLEHACGLWGFGCRCFFALSPLISACSPALLYRITVRFPEGVLCCVEFFVRRCCLAKPPKLLCSVCFTQQLPRLTCGLRVWLCVSRCW